MQESIGTGSPIQGTAEDLDRNGPARVGRPNERRPDCKAARASDTAPGGPVQGRVATVSRARSRSVCQRASTRERSRSIRCSACSHPPEVTPL